MKTFSGYAFELTLPKGEFVEKNLHVSINFMYRKQSKEKVVFRKATLVDKLKYVFECESNTFCVKNKFSQFIDFDLQFVKQKPVMKDAKLVLEFLSESGEKVLVEYVFESLKVSHLMDVSKTVMDNEEKQIYINAIQKQAHIANIKEDVQKEMHNIGPSIVAANIPGLEKYKKALEQEKNFLRANGGKKYKVSNGRLISESNGDYTYVFELETELYISDDAPVTLSIGINQYDGTVMLCEDFEIIVVLDKNIGASVPSAYINVEPWKLLEMLQDKLGRVIGVNGAIAEKLLNDGAKLATKEPIEKIPKGQEEVLSRAMKEPVTIVWGPPGTGKTHTMSELAIRFMKQGKSILLVSHSNVSVDGVARKIYDLLEEKKEPALYCNGKILRYGYIRDEELSMNSYISSFKYAVSQNKKLNEEYERLQTEYNKIKQEKGIATKAIIDIHKKIGKIKAEIKKEEIEAVKKATVVATTISKVVMDKLFDEKTYDVVMFDEVSMAYVLQVVCAATYAKKHMICVGDFMQLPPIAQSEAKDILCEDIFSHLGINVNGKPYYHPWLVMLNEQRRMHPSISRFPNRYVYGNMLKDHSSVLYSKDSIVNAVPFKGQPMNLIDLTGTYCAAGKTKDNSRYNILSALISVATALEAEKNQEKVSIITPYAAQTRLVRALLQDYKEKGKTRIRCATVHQFQGSESDVVLFGAVESYPGSQVGFLMGKDMQQVKRLINVAVTRAKGKLIMVNNAKFWENGFKGKNHILYKLQEHMINEGNQIAHKDRRLEELIDSCNTKDVFKFYSGEKAWYEQLEKDIRNARGKVVVSLPSAEFEFNEKLNSLLKQARKNGVMVLVKTNEHEQLSKDWKDITTATENADFPIVIIDDKITWYGAPQAKWSFSVNKLEKLITVCPISCRIRGHYSAEMIKSLTELEFGELGKKVFRLGEASEHQPDCKEGGLAAYVEKNMKCKDCNTPLKMIKSKSGATVLWCAKEKKVHLLTIQDVNKYIAINRVGCPECGKEIEAKLGKWGLYIRCKGGHFSKLEDI